MGRRRTEPVIFHKLKIETRNFTFEAYGLTKEDANVTMCRAISLHGSQYPDADLGYLIGLVGEAEPVEIRVGAMYRDGEEISWPEERG